MFLARLRRILGEGSEVGGNEGIDDDARPRARVVRTAEGDGAPRSRGELCSIGKNPLIDDELVERFSNWLAVCFLLASCAAVTCLWGLMAMITMPAMTAMIATTKRSSIKVKARCFLNSCVKVLISCRLFSTHCTRLCIAKPARESTGYGSYNGLSLPFLCHTHKFSQCVTYVCHHVQELASASNSPGRIIMLVLSLRCERYPSGGYGFAAGLIESSKGPGPSRSSFKRSMTRRHGWLKSGGGYTVLGWQTGGESRHLL